MNLTQEIQSKGRFQFVADWVVRMTASEENRELVSMYQVIENDNAYMILFEGGESGYGWMTAEEINSWFVRLPLNYFALEAEQMVVEIRKT